MPINDTSVIPAVWYVRIPDPICTTEPCDFLTLQVEGGAVQRELWNYDSTGDHVLGPEDLGQKTGTASSMLAQIFFEAQKKVGGMWRFESAKQIYDLAMTSAAINRAHTKIRAGDVSRKDMVMAAYRFSKLERDIPGLSIRTRLKCTASIETDCMNYVKNYHVQIQNLPYGMQQLLMHWSQQMAATFGEGFRNNLKSDADWFAHGVRITLRYQSGS